MKATLTALVLLALSASAATAQDRSPAQRQTLVELAYVLGQSHALRQACAGPGDQYWRGRMRRLIQAETPDAGLERQLTDAFNTGFVEKRAAYPSCGRSSRREETRAAAHGRALAASLARPVAQYGPAR